MSFLSSLKFVLGPQAERQRSFSNADLSVCPYVRPSVHPSVKSGGGVNLSSASVTFFLFGMELLWDDINHISKD